MVLQRTQVYLHPDLHRRARLHAVEHGTSLTRVISEALTRYLLQPDDLAAAPRRRARSSLDDLIGFIQVGRPPGKTVDDEIYGERG
jgi:hypothetical protein